MGNKQEKLQAIMQQEKYDTVVIMETWWDDSHNWSVAKNGDKLFRRDRQERRGSGVTLCVRECFDCQTVDSDEWAKCSWVRIRGKANNVDIMVGFCYRPLNQGEQTDEIFYQQLGEVSRLLAFILMGTSTYQIPAGNTIQRKQARWFLECVEDNFLTQLVSEPTREGAPLDLLFANRERLVGDVMVGGRLGYHDHETIEFSILREVRRGGNRNATLDFQRADFGLFRSLIDRVL